MTDGPRPNDFLVGLTGPGTVVPAHLAYWLASDFERAVEAQCTRLGSSSPERQADMRALATALRISAEAYARSLRTASGAPSGHLPKLEQIDAHDLPEMGWLSTAQVAERLGLTPRTVRRLAAEGRIVSRRVGRDLRIDPASLTAYQEQRSA